MTEFLRDYNKKYLLGDLSAGLILGVLLIPQGMAYAVLAGMPPIYGLYAGVIPPLIYALLGTSPHLSVGPVSITSILILAGISGIAPEGSEEFISLTIIAGLLAGILQMALGVFKMGFFVSLISRPVIAGFTSAAAFIIIISQLGDIFGFSIPHSEYSVKTLGYLLSHFNEIHWMTFSIFSISLLGIILLKKINKALPASLIVIVVFTTICWKWNLDQQGVDIIGSIPPGLPGLKIPSLNIADIIRLLPTVLTLLIIGIVGSMSLAKAVESKHDYYEVRPNQEMIALGMAKIAGSFFQSLPTDGSFSRSTVASNNGGRTSLSSVFAAVLVGICLIFFTSLLHYLPFAVLSAVIVMAVLNLIEYEEAKILWSIHRSDFWMLIITFFITLGIGILDGVIWGVALSIFLILIRSMKPRLVELGRIKGSTRYGNLEREDVVPIREDILVLRFEEQLYFANAAYFKEKIREHLRQHGTPPKHVILDAGNIHSIDSTGIRALREIDRELEHQNITLHLANDIGPVRDILKKSNLLTGESRNHPSMYDGIQRIITDHYGSIDSEEKQET